MSTETCTDSRQPLPKNTTRWMLHGRILTDEEVEANRVADQVRATRIQPTPEQIQTMLATTKAALEHMRKNDAGTPISPVLKASTIKSLKVSTRKHNGNLAEIGAYCSDPRNCRVCSGLGITGGKSEGNRREIGGKLQTISGTISGTSDAPTHTSTPLRDYRSSSLSQLVNSSSPPHKNKTGEELTEEEDKTIPTKYANTDPRSGHTRGTDPEQKAQQQIAALKREIGGSDAFAAQAIADNYQHRHPGAPLVAEEREVWYPLAGLKREYPEVFAAALTRAIKARAWSAAYVGKVAGELSREREHADNLGRPFTEASGPTLDELVAQQRANWDKS